MNKGLVEYLKEYMLNPDPQYAIMINGRWGCGKTFFIKNWLKKYEDDKNNVDKILKPIYVSLYGLKETKQITSAINRVLYPFMYGKAAKIGKAVWKCASAIAFKQDINLNGDEQNDMSINISLDSLSILKSDDEVVKSDKFLIFDDIERCQVDMTELLGYINYFVEHCHCRVLIIGDENQLEDDNKKVFEKFKEKTIGREFLLKTEVDAAIEFFVKELDNPFLISHIDYIKKTFRMTHCDNLRILRQSLWDFCSQESLVEHNSEERYEQVMTNLLCTFIATYCEYKGENKIVIDEWKELSKDVHFLISKDEKTNLVKQRIKNIENKYCISSVETLWGIFPTNTLVFEIVNYIKTGCTFTNYIHSLIHPQQEKSSWERLHNAEFMSNEDFDQMYNEIIENIIDGKISNIEDIGRTLSYLSYFDVIGVRKMTKENKEKIKEILSYLLKKSCTAEECYKNFVSFIQGINSRITNFDMPILNEFCAYVRCQYETLKENVKDSMTQLLENLTDDNCEDLFEMNKKSLPDHSNVYNHVAIFHLVDIDNLFYSLKNVTNKGRQVFNSFIRERYMLNYDTVSDLNYDKNKDIEPLEILMDKMDKEKEHRTSMERLSFEMICNSLKEAIATCVKNNT